MDEQNDLELAQGSLQKNAIAFRAFLRNYELMHPKPRVNWQFPLLAIPLVAIMFAAASRTAFAVYIMATRFSQRFLGNAGLAVADWYAKGDAFFFILGVEGLLVALGILEGYNKGRSNFNNWWFKGILLAISTLAGLGQSLEIVQDLSSTVLNLLQVSLALVAGLGISFLAYFAAEHLGAMIRDRSRIDGQWAEDAFRAFQGTAEYRLLTADVRREVRLRQAETRALEQNVSGLPEPESLSERSGRQLVLPNSMDVITWYREVYGEAETTAQDMARLYLSRDGQKPHIEDVRRLGQNLRQKLYVLRNSNGNHHQP